MSAADGVLSVLLRHVEDVLWKVMVDLGGPGSGNYGHAGRPGQVGGSMPTKHMVRSTLPNYNEHYARYREGKIGWHNTAGRESYYDQKTTRGAIKHAGATAMGADIQKAGAPLPDDYKHIAESQGAEAAYYKLANDIQKSWSDTSNDSGGWQDVLHHVALAEAGQDTFSDGWPARTMKFSDERLAVARAAYQSIHRRTQEYFRKQGFRPDDELVVYRGMNNASIPGAKNIKAGDGELRVDLRSNPLSSWSLSRQTATHFGTTKESYKPNTVSAVFATRVRVRDIWSHAASGFGCASEDEIIMRGDRIRNPGVINLRSEYGRARFLPTGQWGEWM